MDYQDVDRILSQVLTDSPENFHDWLEANVCCDCILINKKGVI